MPATSAMQCCAYPVRWVRCAPLRWHTKKKRRTLNDIDIYWYVMSCAVWHQIGHCLTCHARSTQYNWLHHASNCQTSGRTLWALSISLHAVRGVHSIEKCLFAQVPVLICESHLDDSQLHSPDALPFAPNCNVTGILMLGVHIGIILDLCMQYGSHLETRSPSFKGSAGAGVAKTHVRYRAIGYNIANGQEARCTVSERNNFGKYQTSPTQWTKSIQFSKSQE